MMQILIRILVEYGLIQMNAVPDTHDTNILWLHSANVCAITVCVCRMLQWRHSRNETN